MITQLINCSHVARHSYSPLWVGESIGTQTRRKRADRGTEVDLGEAAIVIGEIWPLIYNTVVLSTSSKTVIVTITSMGVGDSAWI
jgi:hypothetical protein